MASGFLSEPVLWSSVVICILQKNNVTRGSKTLTCSTNSVPYVSSFLNVTFNNIFYFYPGCFSSHWSSCSSYSQSRCSDFEPESQTFRRIIFLNQQLKISYCLFKSHDTHINSCNVNDRVVLCGVCFQEAGEQPKQEYGDGPCRERRRTHRTDMNTHTHTEC